MDWILLLKSASVALAMIVVFVVAVYALAVFLWWISDTLGEAGGAGVLVLLLIFALLTAGIYETNSGRMVSAEAAPVQQQK